VGSRAATRHRAGVSEPVRILASLEPMAKRTGVSASNARRVPRSLVEFLRGVVVERSHIEPPVSYLPYKSRTVTFGGTAMTTTKKRRFELRTDEATDQLISEAADLLHVTKSAFVADAARQAAEKIIARSDVTLMSPVVFDTMMASLDIPDESPELAELAKLPRLITQ